MNINGLTATTPVKYELTNPGDYFIFLQENPYEGVTKILDYTLDVELYGPDNNYIDPTEYDVLKAEFRWSYDNKSWSEWTTLTLEDLQTINLTKHLFYISLKLSVDDIVLGNYFKFTNFTLETEQSDNTLKAVPQIIEVDETCCYANIVLDCADNLFNPYDLNKPTNVYQQLADLSGRMFGHKITYFRTEPIESSKDVIFHEYSLSQVAESADFKILFPGNEIPTNEVTFDMFGMEFEAFEGHITFSEFRRAFCDGIRPREGDFLYLPLNERMYEIKGVNFGDEFNREMSYWKVNLRKYTKRGTVIDNPLLSEDIDDLSQVEGFEDKTGSATILNDEIIVQSFDDVFKEEVKEEYKKVVKEETYKVITYATDKLRSFYHPKLVVGTENIYNNFTILSKNHYRLQNVPAHEVAIQWERPNVLLRDGSIMFNYRFDTLGLDSFIINKLKNDDLIGTEQSGSLLKVLERNGEWIKFKEDSVLLKGIKYVTNGGYECEIVEIREGWVRFNNDIGSHVFPLEKVLINSGEMIITISDKTLNLLYRGERMTTDISPIKKNWYFCVINFNGEYNNISFNIWGLDASSSRIGDGLSHINSKTFNVELIESNTEIDGELCMLGGAQYVGHIRIFDNIIPQEKHKSVLSQYIVRDYDNVILFDNALPHKNYIMRTNTK